MTIYHLCMYNKDITQLLELSCLDASESQTLFYTEKVIFPHLW